MQQPLDYQPRQTALYQKADHFQSIGQYLEVIPIVILIIGMVLHHYGIPSWRPVILFGGSIAVMIYVVFCYLMYHLGRYNTTEFGLALLTALLFPLGISEILFPEWAGLANFMMYCLLACSGLFVVATILFVLHLTDARASTFYRSMMARVMVIGVILVKLWV